MRTVASGLSHGTEMLVYRGQVPVALALDLPTLAGSFAFPIKYGYAAVGRVIESGPGVALAPGTLVFCLHPHQDGFVAPAALATPLPEAVAPEVGVFLANLETAITILLDAHPHLGERVVIFGQGVVGLLVTQLLRRTGAEPVIAVDALPRRRELARRLGAHAALAPDADVVGEVHRLTEDAGADLAIEVSGAPEALGTAIECVGFQGTVVVASWYGAKPVALPLGGSFHRDRKRLVSSQVGHIDPALEPRWSSAHRMALALRFLAELPLAELITHRIPFERAVEAYELVDCHPEEVVQVVLTYE